MTTTTLLFAQNAIKAVKLTEDCITVFHGDGAEPVHINSDDVMYEYHRKQFNDLATQNLATKGDDALDAAGESTGPSLVE